jgi:hypothetical protein
MVGPLADCSFITSRSHIGIAIIQNVTRIQQYFIYIMPIRLLGENR